MSQVVKTQSMRASPYIGPFEERVRAWEARLAAAQDALDAWLQCQKVSVAALACTCMFGDLRKEVLC